MTTYTATYSANDNKLRLTASARLDADTYARVKAAGYSWAPKLEQFIAPMWTPGREDIALELAGEIGDEDGTLMDRAEVRAERFDDYQAKRGAESARALDHMHSIMDGIPLGQPIMVGHHSEAHARRDAKRIEAGMKRAVDLFDTAEYWKRRAAAALRHAQFKERPDVRHRRIKGIEADARKVRKNIENAEQNARVWAKVPRFEWDKQTAVALHIAGRCSGSFGGGLYSELSAGRMHGDTAWRRAVASADAYVNGDASRWLAHYENRLVYERAMLDESGGITAAGFDLQPGGTITHRGRRSVILRVNRSEGAAVSVSVTGQGWTVGIEEITGYEAPSEAAAAAVKVATKKAPLVNYESEGCARMTQAEWTGIYADTKGTVTVAETETHAAHRRRFVPGYVGTKFGAPRGEQWSRSPVFITDAKISEAPPLHAPVKAPRKSMARKIAEAAGVDTSATPEAAPVAAPTFSEEKAEARALLADLTAQATPRPRTTQSAPLTGDSRADEIKAVREALRTGVQVVSAPQLFPTPPTLAARMVDLAEIEPTHTVCEPSAGTGRLVDAIIRRVPLRLHCVEINRGMAAQLQARHAAANVHAGDWLECSPADIGRFDRIVMNPPFAGGADVDHVTHAVQFLAPGARLVSIMSAGVLFRSDRKTVAFRRMVEAMNGTIEELPPGTFESSGTGVNTVLVVLEAPDAPRRARDDADQVDAPATVAAPSAPAAPAAVADPQLVAEIVSNQMRRRVEWASDLGPLPIDIEREARGLDEIAAQPDVGGDIRVNYRAAAVRLREIARSPEAIAAAVRALQAPPAAPPARDWVETAGRWFRVLATFNESDVDGANAFMGATPGAALLLIADGLCYIASRFDQGTTREPALDAATV